jgi:hypothetical protein
MEHQRLSSCRHWNRECLPVSLCSNSRTSSGSTKPPTSVCWLKGRPRFYENVLKFKAVRCDILRVKEGGQIRHIFFDTGRDQLIAFMEARGVTGVPAQYDARINHGLGVPNAFYHFAVEAGSEAALDEMRNALIARGVEVTDVVDHDWAKSILLQGPQRDSAGVLLLLPEPERERRPDAGARRDLDPPVGTDGRRHTDAGGDR